MIPALPVGPKVTPVPLGASSRPLLRVVTNDQLSTAQQAADEQRVADTTPSTNPNYDPDLTQLAGFIRQQYDQMKRHRDMAVGGWSQRLLTAQRVFNGKYDPSQLAEIQRFGGSEVYARVVAMKCRGASSLLRDVYLAADRPWGLDPPDDPDIPPQVLASISQLAQAEMSQAVIAASQPPPPDPSGAIQPPPPPPDQGAMLDAMRDRITELTEKARQTAKKKARKQALIAEDKIDEHLQLGGFYRALAEFIVDLPLFPFACIKGPVVRIVPSVVWQNGVPSTQNKPRLFWNRISPFDIWWTPGAASIEDAAVIERTRVTRADLNDLLDLPGYNQDALRGVLEDYGAGGLNENWDSADSERAVNENRENPVMNQSGLITCLEYHGNVQGRMLREYGMSPSDVPDELRDYFIQAWLIGRYIIKVQLSPSPRKRHPYFVTSFEKVPGTPVGNGLPDILNDIQDVCNASLRALVNNLSISSGPQVVVNDDRIAAGEDADELFPWKRWHVSQNPMPGSTEKPIDFFQPQSNAQNLIQVYQSFSALADDLSAIPRYLAGESAGGAGRTASGLAMLMGNASKILQTVAANIDRDVLEPLLAGLLDMVLLTDTSGLLTGEETVRVLGVNVAVQKETQRSRQLEFLQQTNNPIDIQIMGPQGRAALLREVSKTLGMDGVDIVPSEDDLDKQQQQAAALAAEQGTPGHGGMGEQAAQAQGSQASQPNGQNGPRTQIVQGPH
jgi:hypothetical protein